MTVEETEEAEVCVFCVMPCSVPKEEMGRWCSLLGKARSHVQTSTPLKREKRSARERDKSE
jgi:hypothetical protein